jgi:hypothetical protein
VGARLLFGYGEHDGMWQGELEVRELAAILLKDKASNRLPL